MSDKSRRFRKAKEEKSQKLSGRTFTIARRQNDDVPKSNKSEIQHKILSKSRTTEKDSKEDQNQIAQSLLIASPSINVIKRTRGRPKKSLLDTPQALPSLLQSPSLTPLSPPSSRIFSSKRKYTPDPDNESRYDEKDHWVVWGSKGRCRLCKTGTPLSKCLKCDVHLCSNTNKNCFLSYHT